MALGSQQPAGRATPADPTSRAARGKNFVNEMIIELRKTTWPTRQEAWRLTLVVVVVIFIVACYMGAIDFFLSWLTDHFHLLPG